MPISRSAKKSLRKSRRNYVSNLLFKNKVKKALKDFQAKKKNENAIMVQSLLDKAMKKGLIHKNKVARLKSQMAKELTKNKDKSAKETTKKRVKRTAKEKMAK